MFTSKVSALWIGANERAARSFEARLKEIGPDFFSVAWSRDIQDALTQTSSQQFQIAFMDSNGQRKGDAWWAAFHQLTQELPVILLTQGDDEEFVFSALEKGAADFLSHDDTSAHSILKTIRYGLQTFSLSKDASLNTSHRSAIEEQFLASQKMESVGRLALNIAHDFNNLLTVILNYSQMVLVKAKDDETLRNRMEAISSCAHRAASLTSQFLAFGRRNRPNPQGISLSSVFSIIEPMLKQTMGGEIDLNFAEKENGLKVFMDPNHLMHVLMSMVQSAQETMPNGGALSVVVSSAYVDDDMSSGLGYLGMGDYVIISVKDSGPGFDKESAEHIFELFGGEKSEGTSVPASLSAINGLVKHAGGHIHVQSELGKGSRFDIYLPRFVEVEVQAVEVKKVAAPEKSLETVLVVDDEDLVRQIAVDVMTQHGYKVLEAPNAIEALKLCEQRGEKIDLVLTDLIMPKMNGPELVRKMAARHPHIRVVYMSGYTDDAFEHIETLEATEGFVQKPFMPKSLLGAVKDALGRSSSLLE
jgi:two-component system cell cycle sensor histidine kinase/response regulator CckA